MEINKKKNIHNQRIYFFDKNYSALSFIKLCIFLNRMRKCNGLTHYNIGEVPDKNNGSKYVMFNIHDDDIFKTSSKIIFKECIGILEDKSIRLTHKDYYIEFSPDLCTIYIGRTCDEAKIVLSINQFKSSSYQINENDRTLRSIMTVIQYDKFKDGGFNNYIKDYVEFVDGLFHQKSTTIDTILLKRFMSPSFKRSFDYSRDVNYDRLYLNLTMHISKNIYDGHGMSFLVGPLRIQIYSKYIIFRFFHAFVEGKKRKGVKLNSPKYIITDINQLPDKVINLFCYIMNNYPGSTSVRKAISNMALNNKED